MSKVPHLQTNHNRMVKLTLIYRYDGMSIGCGTESLVRVLSVELTKKDVERDLEEQGTGRKGFRRD